MGNTAKIRHRRKRREKSKLERVSEELRAGIARRLNALIASGARG